MIKVERFLNDLMSSNCYIIWDDITHSSIVVDPGSEKSQKVIDFIDSHNISLDYIFLTHEHTDHTWGVNALIERFNAKVICSEDCRIGLSRQNNCQFQLYLDDTKSDYRVSRVDYTTEELDNVLYFNDIKVQFIPTPGHSASSVCLLIENMLFTGDAMLLSKPVIIKRSGGNREVYQQSVMKLIRSVSKNTMIFPGHGEPFQLNEYAKQLEPIN